ncbi:MAG: DMT family transporter [Archangium sp.]
MKRTTSTGMALIAIAATLWGTWPLYTRSGALSGICIGFITLAVMSLPAPFAFRRTDFADRGAVIALVIVGLADAANVVLYFSALSRGPVVVAVLTHYLTPSLVAIFAPLVLKEPRSRRALIATPIVLTGLALVLGPTGADTSWLPTAALGAGSALFYSTLVLGSRRAGRTFTPLAVTSLHSVVSIVALLAVYRGEVFPPSLEAATPVLFAALINGLFAALLFNRALNLIGAQLVGMFTYLEPLTAALIGVLVLHEPFTALGALGVAIVLGAGVWAAAEPQQPQRIAAGDMG